MGKWYKDGAPYRPSNGTEGMSFEEDHCLQCLHCDPNPGGKKQCGIWGRAVMHNISDPEYPREWQYKDDKPICTNWKKWDWGNDGDPDDPDNPKAPPPPPDPNQLNIFPLYPKETDFDKKEEVQIRQLS